MGDSAGIALPIFGYTGDEEQAEQLREFFVKCGAKSLEGKEALSVPDKLLAMAKEVAAVGKALADSSAIMHTLNSLASLVIPMPEKSEETVGALCGGLARPEVFAGEGVGSKAYAAFCVLSNLFHGFAPVKSSMQFRIYTAMLEVAGRGGFMGELPSGLDQLRDWFAQWGLDVADRRRCLRLVHAGLSRHGHPQAAKVMAELLSTYSAADAGEAGEDAKNCVLAAIKDPKNFLYDHLVQLSPVKALASTNAPLWQLLQLLVSGTLKDYQAFAAKEKSLIAGLGLDQAAMVHKMRILTLMSLAETRTEMGMTELAEALSMAPDEELEEFIIQASLSGAVRGRMDQVGQRVVILDAESRRFERKEWELLRDKLAHWAAALANVDATVQHALTSSAPA